MPSTSSETTPAIFKLNPDIVLHIFTVNANLKYGSLQILRNTSQVCSSWRNLILHSPALWSRALDVNSFRREGEWEAEVIKRTGNSRLRVEAQEKTMISLNNLVRSILDRNWLRIRCLDLQFSRWCPPLEEWLSILQRPAPSLETCKIIFPDTEPVSLSPALFANHAPSLRNFSVCCATLDLTKASWASNLCLLEVVSPVPLSELLPVFFITQFTFLEKLDLRDGWTFASANNPIAPLHVRPVSLPSLKRIKVHSNHYTKSALSFLSNIIPAVGCELDFYGMESTAETLIVDDMPSIFPKYLPDPKESAPFTEATLALRGYKLYFSLCRSSGRPAFQFVISCKNTDLPEEAVSTFISSLPTFDLNKIKSLDLSISFPNSDLANAIVEQFLLCAPCVEELVTGIQTLERLDMFRKRLGAVVFPCLKRTKRP